MNILTVLEMAASGLGDRQAMGRRGEGPTYQELYDQAGAGAARLSGSGSSLVFIGQSGPAFATAFFAAAWAGIPFVPLNYRLSGEALARLVRRCGPGLVVSDNRYSALVASGGLPVTTLDEWLESIGAGRPGAGGGGPAAAGGAAPEADPDPTGAALHLFTSGTTAEPKAAILGHDNLSAYIFGSVDFAGAGEEEAALVSVPPYHIAGVANLLSNVFAGRRIIYLPDFDPASWLEVVRAEGVTQAMVVPTMLARIVEEVGAAPDAGAPDLRLISYGGARMPVTTLERALRLFPGAGFVNAYGLTETSSSIAVLGPDDHRAALGGESAPARARLSSVGRVLPGVEVEIRSDDGRALGPEQRGEIWVRGEQVSGRYAGQDSPLDPAGWFPTRDAGWLDAEGYLFVEGRTDDTIIRGGENIAPAEIEEVLLAHPDVLDAAAVGLPDEEWGQRIGAAVVLRAGGSTSAADLSAWTREHLRASKTAEVVVIREALPRTDTGKLLRREVLADLESQLPVHRT